MSTKVIAFYLPQLHPIPENDVFWGKGFTEWTNVRKAIPLYKGHDQPRVPADLGYYDLRDATTREVQALLARTHGVDAFCYYHYWFAGKRVLEAPFSEVLKTGKPDFPFVLCWANQSWTGVWYGCPDRVLIEQTYPGDDDYTTHFYSLLDAFQDLRYLRIKDKPVFIVFRPFELPDKKRFTQLWTKLAQENGLNGIYFIGLTWNSEWDHQSDGFDAAVTQKNLPPRPLSNAIKKRGLPTLFDADAIIPYVVSDKKYTTQLIFPCLMPNWDNTPRSGGNGLVMVNSNPENFRRQIKRALESIFENLQDEKIIFIKAWNEWAEGNYMEPDTKYGTRFLEVLKEELDKAQ
jgi:lipopolysaccharide biosynthesis protein